MAFHHGAGNSSQVRNYNYSDISNNNKSNLLKSHYIKVWYFQRIYSDGELKICKGVWNNHGGVEERGAGGEEEDNQLGGGGAPRPEGGRLVLED